MGTNFESLAAKITIIVVCFFAGLFSVAIALATQFVKLESKNKRFWVFLLSLQFVLSIGVFFGVVLFFNSSLLPPGISNDLWTMLVSAYFCASIPEIIITTLIIVLNKEVNKIFEKRYGERILPESSFAFANTRDLGANVENGEAQSASLKGMSEANDEAILNNEVGEREIASSPLAPRNDEWGANESVIASGDTKGVETKQSLRTNDESEIASSPLAPRNDDGETGSRNDEGKTRQARTKKGGLND